MSFDEHLADRDCAILATRDDIGERTSFGGLCFLEGGHTCCGLTATDFMVRVGPGAYEDALSQPHARPMDFTGRPLVGMVYVAPAGTRTSAALAKWVKRGVEFASNLPPKTKAKKKKRAVLPRLQRRARG